MRRLGGLAAAAWTLAGVSVLFVTAELRLGRRGMETVQADSATPSGPPWRSSCSSASALLWGVGAIFLEGRKAFE